MDTLKPPDALNLSSGNVAENWRRWSTRWELYKKAAGVATLEQDVQCAVFLHVIGDAAVDVYETMTFADGENNRLEPLVKKFKDYCNPRKNVTFERYVFNCRNQKEEGIDQYVTELKTLAGSCEYGVLRDGLIRDRVVCGINDNSVRGRLLRDHELTLEKAVTTCRAQEAADIQMKSMSLNSNGGATGTASSSEVNEVQRNRKHRYTQSSGDRAKDKGKRDSHNDRKCVYCGYEQHDRAKCPAREKVCNRCNRKGHFGIACLQKKTQNVHEITKGDDEAEGYDDSDYDVANTDSYFLGAVSASNVDSVSPWRTELMVNGMLMNFKIDCGADVSIISDKTFHKLKRRPLLKPSSVELLSPGGRLECAGQFVARVERKGKTTFLRVFVVKGSVDNLLSRGAAVNMGLIARIDAVKKAEECDRDVLRNKTVQIQVRDDASPYCAFGARNVAIPQMPLVKAELQRMERLGVIAKVTEPTEWCNHMVVVHKPKGGLRICVDLKPLNKAIKRERYMLPTVDDTLHSLSGATVFSSLDAASGYWQLALDEDSSKYTTFITPFGRYRFLRVPFGISSASEIFQREMTELLSGLSGVAIYQDDVIVSGADVEEHDLRLTRVLDVIEKSGLKLNRSKCKIRRSSLDFLGFHITGKGVSPHKEKVQAIVEMDPPKDVAQLRQVLGMINYLARHVKDLADVAKPLHELLRKDTAWGWGEPQQRAFDRLKELISTAPVLAFYDVNRPTIVSADASRYGLGGVLLQQYSDGLKPVAYCSQTLTSAELRYAQIEKECLASTWACEKFQKFLCGLESFTLYTDHKPLVPLMNDKNIQQAPLRCQRLLLCLMRFNARAVHVPGKELVVADALSRSPLPLEGGFTPETVSEVQAHVDAIGACLPMTNPMLAKIGEETQKDGALKRAIEYVLEGWPRHKDNVEPELYGLYMVGNEMSVVGGLLVRGTRIIIPKSMREDVLNRLHHGHQGLTKCRERAAHSVWWPGLTNEITQIVETCELCQKKRDAQPHETLMSTTMPGRPWQKIGTDLCTFGGQQYLVVVDYYLRYLEMAHLGQKTTAHSIINRLKNVFSRWGIPDCVMSDNGPQYDCREFAEFAETYGFEHNTSSPHFSQSNGMAERAVGITKDILRQKDPFLGLMAYRDTPTASTGYSPNELMLGRQVRTTVPVLPELLQPRWPNPEMLRASDKRNKEKQAMQYNC